MGLFDRFRRKKKKKDKEVKEAEQPSEWYVLQGREIGKKRWLTYGEGDEFPDIDALEEQGIFVPGYEYRVIKKWTDEHGRKKQEELWRKSYGEPVTAVKARTVDVNKGVDKPIIQVDTERLKSLAEQVRQLREISREIQGIFSDNTSQNTQLPTDAYEGKLPIWMHPQVADGLGKMLGSLVGGLMGAATGGEKQKKSSSLDEIDKELED